jgi:deoxycytidylate deaminase
LSTLPLVKFFRLAKKESRKNTTHRIKVGAVITKNGRVLSLGHNLAKTHPAIGTYQIHAEAAAIIAARHELMGASIWVYRETADGIPGMAKPCSDCMALIIHSGIERVYYSHSEFPYFDFIKLR